MAIINLGPLYFVEIEDGYNYTLKKRCTVTGNNARGKKPKAENIGNEIEKTLGFFASLEQLMQRATFYGLCDTNSDDMKDIMKVIREFKEVAKYAAEFDSKFRKSLKH
jgi:hypothetical protein